MAFTPQFLDELRARIDLAGLIGKRVRLQKRGREHLGLCPFHNEKTPSFTVNEDKGFYHCFGCGEHGSGIDFVMKLDNLSFPEAVERLAGEAGMEGPRTTPEERQRAERAKSHYVILEAAAAHFEKQLRLPVGKPARDYLQARGISEASIRRFRLGFAPNARDGLKSALARDRIKGGALVESGLLIEPDEEDRPAYDRFRGRVMFPITDLRGRVIAFGGRILGEGEPKYLNSPETPLFQKRQSLYGLAQAMPTIRKLREAVVVEGYTDVIALHQFGIETAVAPLGTALTEEQISLVGSSAVVTFLCFDADSAGERAAGRALEKALPNLKRNQKIHFVVMPPGEDPDSILKKNGAQYFRKLMSESPGLGEILWNKAKNFRSLTNLEDRAGAKRRINELTEDISDSAVKSELRAFLNEKHWNETKTRPKSSQRNLGTGPAPRPMAARSGVTAHVDTIRLQEEILITTVITHPALFDRVDETLGTLSFSSPELDKLRQEVLNTLSGAPDLDFEGLTDHLRSTGFRDTLGGLLSRRVYNHARFARPDQPLTDAEKGWEQLYRLYRRTQLLEEISAAEARLKAEPTREAFEVLKALKASASTMDEDTGDEDAGPTETMRRTAGDGAA